MSLYTEQGRRSYEVKSEKCFRLSKGLVDVYDAVTGDVLSVRHLHVTYDGTNTKR